MQLCHEGKTLAWQLEQSQEHTARCAHAIQTADLISALLPNAGEGYLQDGDATVAYTGDELEAMQAASTAVSRMVAQDVSALSAA